MNNQEIKKNIAKMIIKAMEENGSDFMKSWVQSGMPKNIRGSYYSGINVFNLWAAKAEYGYGSNTWATFNQIRKAGGKVTKGEHGHFVQGWFSYEKETILKNGDIKTDDALAMKFYKVFNLDQTDLTEKKLNLPDQAVSLIAVDDYIANTKADIRYDYLFSGNPESCYYSPDLDFIGMVSKNKFMESDQATATENYYSVLLHELTHWTGHKKRLDRFSNEGDDRSRLPYMRTLSSAYAFEELIAEIGSAIQCCILGLSSGIKPSSAKYLNTWIKEIKKDESTIFHACAKANQAVRFIEKLQKVEDKKVA